jgi:hypothetical protein
MAGSIIGLIKNVRGCPVVAKIRTVGSTEIKLDN